MNKRDLARRLREECEVVKRLEHRHYLDGKRIVECEQSLREAEGALRQMVASHDGLPRLPVQHCTQLVALAELYFAVPSALELEEVKQTATESST